jgi:hypothetical protein
MRESADSNHPRGLCHPASIFADLYPSRGVVGRSQLAGLALPRGSAQRSSRASFCLGLELERRGRGFSVNLTAIAAAVEDWPRGGPNSFRDRFESGRRMASLSR